MKYVLIYDNGDLSRVRELYPAHQARWKQFQEQGTLLMIGPLVPPADLGALAIFKTREAAEGFAKADPFVLEGVVKSWRVLEWREALVES